MATLGCVVCKTEIGDGERFVLIRGRLQEVHCSQVCLVANVERRRLARAAVRRRWLLRAAALTLVVVGGDRLWHRFHAPRPRTISFEPPEIRPTPAPPGHPPTKTGRRPSPSWPGSTRCPARRAARPPPTTASRPAGPARAARD